MLTREHILAELSDLAGRTTELRQAIERPDAVLPPLVAARIALETSKMAVKLARLTDDAHRSCKKGGDLPGIG